MEEEEYDITHSYSEISSFFLQMGYKLQLMLHNNYNPEL